MLNALDISGRRIPKRELFPEKAQIKTKFGASVLWQDRSDGGNHLSEESLEPYSLLGDRPLDRIIEMLDKEGKRLRPGDDLLMMAEMALKTEYSSRSAIQKEMASFLETYNRIPEWVDLEQIKRGQDVYLAYAPAVGLSLYYRSLIAGFSIPKIAAVVQCTGYLAPPSRPDQALQRLLDTGELVVACTALGVDALLPGGAGWKTALYVRILHAKVRFAILKRQGRKKWNIQKLGIPINQEDMAATTLAFSSNVLDGIDLIAGISVPIQEQLDYLALWRYIGWLLGVETGFCSRREDQPSMQELPPLDPCGPGVGAKPDPMTHSRAILDSVIFHLLHPDNSSVRISHHLLQVSNRKPLSTHTILEKTGAPSTNARFFFRCYMCRCLIGDPLADALLLPFHPNLRIRIMIYLMSAFFLFSTRLYTNAAMWILPARRWIVRWHRKANAAYHETWSRTHRSKMAKALARNEKASTLDIGNAINENVSASSLCPFAMTAKPT